MFESALWFLALSLSCILVQAFFSMFEMAAVSFNKVRLKYYASLNHKNATWLDYLLQKPSRLFGTTMIMVNTMLQVGSEASRRFYESLHLSPDFAPFSQFILVVIFAELAPLFAARKHPESVALFNVSVVYFFSKILLPFIWVIDAISSFFNWIFGKKAQTLYFLTKEEIQKIIEEKDKKSNEIDIGKTITNIFSLKNVNSKQLMIPLASVKMVSSIYTLEQLKHSIKKDFPSYIPVYHQNISNVVSIVSPRDLLKASSKEKILNYGKSPWFVTENLSILNVLKQFRHNNQTVAVILDKTGKSIGILTLDMIMDLIFGVYPSIIEEKTKQIFIEKTLHGEMLVSEFNTSFKADLPLDKGRTLSDLITHVLGHHPSTGEVIQISNFEFVILEPAIFGTKTVLVRSLM
jgi:putative hemolysin